MNVQSATADAEWRAYWPVVLSAMFGMSFYAMVNYSFDQFARPIEQEFGMTRSEIFLGLTIFNFMPVLLGPPVGALIDRYGTRSIAIPGMILSVAAFAALSLANGSVAQWSGLWLMFGLCALLIKSTVWTAAISKLFTTSRGFALSVMLSGTAVAEGVAKILPNWLIVNYGWRFAYVAVAGFWGGLTLVLVLVFFRETGRRANGKNSQLAPPVPQSTATLPGLTMGEAVRSRAILLLSLANFITSIVGSGISMHISLILKDTGLDRSDAAMIAATAGISGIAGKLITGWLCDRTRSRWLPFTSFACGALGFALLLNPFNSPISLILGVMIIGYGGGAGFQITAFLCSQYAGLRNFGKIFASVASAMMLGAAIGPLLSGKLYDIFGSYHPLIMAAIPVALTAGLISAFLGPYPAFSTAPKSSGI